MLTMNKQITEGIIDSLAIKSANRLYGTKTGRFFGRAAETLGNIAAHTSGGPFFPVPADTGFLLKQHGETINSLLNSHKHQDDQKMDKNVKKVTDPLGKYVITPLEQKAKSSVNKVGNKLKSKFSRKK